MKGQTWTNLDKGFVRLGIFDEKTLIATNMVVVGKQGFHETLNGAKTWKPVASLPPDFNVGVVGPNYA